MQWKPEQTGGMFAQTRFARLVAWRDQSKRSNHKAPFRAGIECAFGGILANQDGFASGEAACRWAEQAYVELLRDELATLEE